MKLFCICLISEKLSAERKTTPLAAAAELGYSKLSLKYWKKCSSPDNDALKRFAEYFGVTVDYMRNGELYYAKK